MAGFLFTIACIFYIIGFVQLFTSNDSATSSYRSPLQQFGAQPNLTQPLVSPEISNLNQEKNMKKSNGFDWIKTGNRISVQHPQLGALMLHVDAQVQFIELWQTKREPNADWVPTGNTFTGFDLETGRYLLFWQNRCYLLDESEIVSDVEIQRDFAPHARKFAQSDQTADVYFAYPPAMWHIDDIGKFRIGSVEGTSRLQEGAVGRFIHCSGDSSRALVIEDYEGAGGQDTVWNGYKIDPSTITSA